jgi:cation diffusion facilitator CzcD-associated flavoprotein CzcO
MTNSIQNFSIVIIGTGFAGLGMAIKLIEQGQKDFIILERGGHVGGTWRDNTYPGAACDVPSVLYSFSFEQNPNWSRTFPSQSELYEYLNKVTDKYQLRPHIHFDEAMEQMVWDEDACTWTVSTPKGTYVADVVIAGTGSLAEAKLADIKGAESFTGDHFHSSQWNHQQSLEGKNVAVIGSGASAIQFVPEVAKQAARIDVYQRTPNWIIPRPDKAIGPKQQWLLANVRLYQQFKRLVTYLTNESRILGIVISPSFLTGFRFIAKRHLYKQVADPALRAAMLPNYAIGCKRILISNDWYPAICRDNVDLITNGIEEIRPSSIVTVDGTEREIDAIVWGTGFYATENPIAEKIVGIQGVKLSEAWANGEYAYKGTAVSGFPNLFFIVGPNITLGHTSMVLMIEAQVTYIRKAMQWKRNNGIKRIEVKEDSERAYNEKLQKRLGGSVWATDCNSWYKHKSGKITALWPDFTFRFRNLTKDFDQQHYKSS